MEYMLIGFLLVLALAAIVYGLVKHAGFRPEPAHRIAGRRGERFATDRIRSVLREGDYLFTNVSVSFEGKPAELDNVIINSYGVFIIEVKYYSGRLSGAEDDFEWTKVHVSRGGNPYVKTVKNPIKQVKRETYILANYLREYGVSVWVDGYAIILGTSSPLKNDCLLPGVADIDRVLHTPVKRRLSQKTVDAVVELLKS